MQIATDLSQRRLRTALADEPPPDQPAQRDHLQHGDLEQVGIERLLAGLVAECPAPRISPQRPAEESEQQQSRFRDAVLPAPGLGLVQPERRKGDDVDREEGGGDVGGGDEVGHRKGLNDEPLNPVPSQGSSIGVAGRSLDPTCEILPAIVM